MEFLPSRFISISLLLLFIISSTASEDDDIKRSLVGFLQKLSPDKNLRLGWTEDTDPCENRWGGITCNNRTRLVRSIVLEGLGLDGSIDAGLLCKASSSLAVISLANNSLTGELPPEINNCSQLTHLYLSGNRLSGRLPSSISTLRNLKRLDISNNNFSGELPDLSVISGLVSFHAEDNRIEGAIPEFDFANLKQFNVSGNLFNGSIPEGGDKFDRSSYLENQGLCGKPLPATCPPPPSANAKANKPAAEKALLYSGYIILGLVVILFIVYKIIKMRKKGGEQNKGRKTKSNTEDSSLKTSSLSSDNKASRSEYSVASSTESALMSTSLTVMKNPMTKELRFEDLLKAPAELVGRGAYGSLYKVLFDNQIALAVKRIKDNTVSAADFRKRMERMDRMNHPNVLPAIAFYCSKQEKLVVYEFQQNESLFKLIHGNKTGAGTYLLEKNSKSFHLGIAGNRESQNFDWCSRLNVAAGIADGLTFMHQELQDNSFGHGNLKSSNILMDINMNPCISEYGLTDITKLKSPDLTTANRAATNGVKADIYSFGVILLELLTGKLVESNGFDLPKWVNSVVREEWTAEVFDKALSESGSEERMVHLLQVALKCVDSSPGDRPSTNEVAKMINSIREDDEKSSFYDKSSFYEV